MKDPFRFDMGQLYVDISMVRAPTDPLAFSKDLKARAKTGEYCHDCPNSLVCVSGHVGVEQCRQCNRVYIEGNPVPEGKCKGKIGEFCEGGFDKQPFRVSNSCPACAEETVKECFREGLENHVGQALTPMLIERIKQTLEATTQRIKQEYGWEFTADVVMEDG